MRTHFPEDIDDKLQKVATLVPRFGVRTILDFIAKNDLPMICGLIGLRNTGKTTMLLHAMASLSDEWKRHSVFLEMEDGELMNDLKGQIDSLAKKGCSIFFIDGITKLEDFTKKSACLANSYSARGLKIIATGDDSLSFTLASRSALYDRVKKVRTTRIPWEEYALINHLDYEINDDYLENGGILSDSASQKADIAKYVQEAIIDNLVFSLDHYENGQHYDALIGLRNNGGLGDLVFRVLEDNTYDFLIGALEQCDDLDGFGDFKNFLHDTFLSEKENAGTSEEVCAVVEWLADMDVFYPNPDPFGQFKSLPKNLLVQPALRWHFAMRTLNRMLDRIMKDFGKDDMPNRNAIEKSVKNQMIREINMMKQ